MHFDATLIPKEGMSISELPLVQQRPLIRSFFNLNDTEWNEFSRQVRAAPKSEQNYYILIAPHRGCWSPLISEIQRVLKCMREITWEVADKKGVLHAEKIMLVPSFTMFQAAINVKAQTLKRKPVELIPTYGYIEAEHYAALKALGKIAFALYLPEGQADLRYNDNSGKFRATIDGYHFETSFAGALHDFYHALREMAMSENVAKARMRLVSIAKKHPRNKATPDSQAVDDILVDGELVHSYPPELDTMFDSAHRPRAAALFGSIFYVSTLKDRLHADLKRAFIRDMVENKDLWQKEFNLGKVDLVEEDRDIYAAIEVEQLTASSTGFSPVRAINTLGLLATRTPIEEKGESLVNLARPAA